MKFVKMVALVNASIISFMISMPAHADYLEIDSNLIKRVEGSCKNEVLNGVIDGSLNCSASLLMSNGHVRKIGELDFQSPDSLSARDGIISMSNFVRSANDTLGNAQADGNRVYIFLNEFNGNGMYNNDWQKVLSESNDRNIQSADNTNKRGSYSTVPLDSSSGRQSAGGSLN